MDNTYHKCATTTEITYFDGTVSADKEIFGFNVTVDDVLGIH